MERLHNKIFYGWWIVISGVAWITFYSSIFAYGFTAFINPILATFGWGMAEMSLATSLRGLETGALNPIWGGIVDRYDPRKLMAIGVAITAVGIFVLSQTANLAMYYAAFIIMGLGGSLCTGMIQTTTLSRWFRKDLGKAPGFYYLGPALGGLLVPVIVIVLDALGWQTTTLFAGIIFVIFGMALAPIYRKSPEDFGQLPDGAKSVEEIEIKPKSGGSAAVSVTAREALKMRAFWQFGIVTFVQHSVLGTVTMFIMPYLTDVGMSRPLAGTAISIMTLLSLTVRVPFGILADKLPKKNIMSLITILMGAGVFVFWMIGADSPFWLVVVFGIIYGLGIGGVNVLRPPILVEYFGARNFGAIFGLNSIAVTASVLSQTFAGWIYDTYHSYKPCWLVLVAAMVIALVLMVTMPKAGGGEKKTY